MCGSWWGPSSLMPARPVKLRSRRCTSQSQYPQRINRSRLETVHVHAIRRDHMHASRRRFSICHLQKTIDHERLTHIRPINPFFTRDAWHRILIPSRHMSSVLSRSHRVVGALYRLAISAELGCGSPETRRRHGLWQTATRCQSRRRSVPPGGHPVGQVPDRSIKSEAIEILLTPQNRALMRFKRSPA